MKLTFYGGVGEVTGANYLLEDGSLKFIVDCGLHQGEDLEYKNYEPFPYDPQKVNSVFITHAHIDHIGRLPYLVKNGFEGKIYSTFPTKDLAHPMLNDALKIMLEKEKKGIAPLYEERDIFKTLKLWEGVDYKDNIQVGDYNFSFLSAGHILGAGSLLISGKNKKILFSGDLGNKESPFIKPFDVPNEDVNFVIMESTYGDRIHKDINNRKEILLSYLKETIKKKGVLLIPAFALERTQELIFELNDIVENKLKEKIKIFIDGPLAFKILEIYKKYSQNEIYFNEEAINLQKEGDDIFNFPGLKLVYSEKESKKILKTDPPKVIIAASGMSSGGRVLFHEIEYLKNPLATLLIVGYQTKDSLGRKLLEGKKNVNILGEKIDIKAKVCFMDGYSAHADKNDLLKWLSLIVNRKTNTIFLVQGEETSALNLSREIKLKFNIKTHIPKNGESVVL